eukprot:s5613_g2.t1
MENPEDAPTTEDQPRNPSSDDGQEPQPEAEPKRRISVNLQHVTENLAQAQGTPVPESPLSSIDEDAAVEPTSEPAPSGPSTASLDTDQEDVDTDHNMEPVYNASLVENSVGNDILVEDDGVAWSQSEQPDRACASFAFEVPQQQLQKFLKRPKEHLPCLTVAAKKSRSEVVYSDLNKEEKELFRQAKQKELKCWLDTSTVKAIVRDRIHPSRILSSRWILTWKEDMTQPSGRKAKARLVVKGFQDPDIDNLCSDSPTLPRDSRMLLFQTVSSMKWLIQSFDITTAFLRGKSDERELAMEAPPELKELMGMTNDQVCLLQGNRVLREAQSFAETSVTVRPLRMQDVCFASFGDASFASAKQLAAQQGLFIMACTPALARNETTDFSPIVWHSKQIARVVRNREEKSAEP